MHTFVQEGKKRPAQLMTVKAAYYIHINYTPINYWHGKLEVLTNPWQDQHGVASPQWHQRCFPLLKTIVAMATNQQQEQSSSIANSCPMGFWDSLHVPQSTLWYMPQCTGHLTPSHTKGTAWYVPQGHANPTVHPVLMYHGTGLYKMVCPTRYLALACWSHCPSCPNVPWDGLVQNGMSHKVPGSTMLIPLFILS